MAKLINLSENSLPSDQAVILDTNIWIYLFSPYSENNFGYDVIWENLLSNETKIYISPLIIAEYVNRICRQAFEEYKQDHHISHYKKEFRPTSQYSFAYKLAQQSVCEEILSVATLEQVSSDDVLKSIEEPDLADFNDDVILNTAIRIKASIITHDTDFKSTNKKIKIYRNFQ